MEKKIPCLTSFSHVNSASGSSLIRVNSFFKPTLHMVIVKAITSRGLRIGHNVPDVAKPVELFKQP